MNAHTIALSILCSTGFFALRSMSLTDACTELNVGTVESLLSKANPIGVVLNAVLSSPKIKAPALDEQPPLLLPAFSKGAATILDALFRAGANPVATAAYKQENVQLLTSLEAAWAQERSAFIQHPLYIAQQKLLHALLVYEVSKPASESKSIEAPVLGDSKLVARYLTSIIALRNLLSDKKNFDPLNTPLAPHAKGIPGQTPVQLAARNGHYWCLKAMLEAKDKTAFTPLIVSCQTAYVASLTASAQGTLSTLWKSCKDLLSTFMSTYCQATTCNNAIVIQTAQNNVARDVWNNPQHNLTFAPVDQTVTAALREAKKLCIGTKKPRFWAP